VLIFRAITGDLGRTRFATVCNDLHNLVHTSVTSPVGEKLVLRGRKSRYWLPCAFVGAFLRGFWRIPKFAVCPCVAFRHFRFPASLRGFPELLDGHVKIYLAYELQRLLACAERLQEKHFEGPATEKKLQ